MASVNALWHRQRFARATRPEGQSTRREKRREQRARKSRLEADKVAECTTMKNHPASIPPGNGASPMTTRLSTDIRRLIFKQALPTLDRTIIPVCDDKECPKWPILGKGASSSTGDRRPNQTQRLMLVCQRFRNEIVTIVYEEGTFRMHLHEGVLHGGIEFLDVGRQALHHKQGDSDKRFYKFGKKDCLYGIDFLKKVILDIFPAKEVLDPNMARLVPYVTAHTALALCHQLQKGEQRANKHKMNSLSIELHAVKAFSKEHYWWDFNQHQPHEKSHHGVTDLEMMLKPFALLRAHRVRIVLPWRLRLHDHTDKFITTLEDAIRGKRSAIAAINVADLEHKLELQRESIFEKLVEFSGGPKPEIEPLSAMEMVEEEEDFEETDPEED